MSLLNSPQIKENKNLIIAFVLALIFIIGLVVAIFLVTRSPEQPEAEKPFRDAASGEMFYPSTNESEFSAEDSSDEEFTMIGFSDVYNLMGQSDYNFFCRHLKAFYNQLNLNSTNHRVSLKQNSLKGTGQDAYRFTIYLHANNTYYDVSYSFITTRGGNTFISFYDSSDKILYSSSADN